MIRYRDSSLLSRSAASIMPALIVALFFGGCAADSAYPNSDAGTGGDCSMTIAFTSPAGPEAPAEITAFADIEGANALAGWRTYSWDVRDDNGNTIAISIQGQDGEYLAFTAATAGPYQVFASGSVGEVVCTPAQEVINVAEPGAPRARYRLRLSPTANQAAPPQERALDIPGGADYDLGDVVLDVGVLVNGSVRDAVLAPVAAYVRATGRAPLSTSIIGEVFSGPDGGFEMRVIQGSYDILVVPFDNTRAPQRFWDIATPGFTLGLTPGLTLTGALTDSSGAPIIGARVSATVDEVPSTLASTDNAGVFAFITRAGAPATMTVTPPQESGLLGLSLERALGVTLDAGVGPLSIAYTDVVAARALNLSITASDGVTPAPGARVTLIARPVDNAGVLTLATGQSWPMQGQARLSLDAGPDGSIAVLAPEALYDVLIEPATGNQDAVTMTTLDVRAGQPAPNALVLVPGARVDGMVMDADGVAIEGARVAAVPTGLWAQLPSAASLVTGADGAFSLTVAAGGSYELVFTSWGARHVRERVSVTAPAGGQTLDLGPIALDRALELRGRVTVPGLPGGAANVSIQLMCQDCQGQDPTWPLAEAITDAFGRFAVPVPDPGS